MKPIIDVHEHIFNARDIPLKGYLFSRKDEGAMERWLRRFIPFVIYCIRVIPISKKKEKIYKKILCKLVLDTLFLIMGNQGRQYRIWAKTLSRKVIYIAKEMIKTYDKDGIDLYVPLMIDYEYWFESTKDTPLKKQIEDIYNYIVIPYKGRIHPFVPFDPARELAYQNGMLNPDKEPEQDGSMKLVKNAIENKGFIGVKLYNSLGYKPLDNKTVDEKRRKKIKLHKKMGYDKFTGDKYDEVLSELYKYCSDNRVPITAHCVMDGIESYPKASYDFGQALFWNDVLDRYKDLHLNLAHFGWNSRLSYHDNRNWIKGICQMLINHKNLYTDVSHHRVISDRYGQRFKSDYEAIRRDWSNYNGIDGWSMIKKKLLFGIDWHVIKRVKNFEYFKEKYLDVLKHKNLFTDKEIDNFLAAMH